MGSIDWSISLVRARFTPLGLICFPEPAALLVVTQEGVLRASKWCAPDIGHAAHEIKDALLTRWWGEGLGFETVLPVPGQKGWVRAMDRIVWKPRVARFVDQSAYLVLIVYVSRDNDFGIVAQSN
jgi:hypothetical protein